MPGIHLGKRVGSSGQSWSSYWASLISATVENAAPTNVVLTFPSGRSSLLATDLSCTVNGAARTINSASWSGGVWTVVLASAVIYGDVVVITFGKTGQTASVTNNVAAEAELTTYITGLTTPLSTNQKIRLNTFVKSIKTGLAITNLSDAFDIMYLLGGETIESSLRNLISSNYNAELAGATVPAHTRYKGFSGNGTGYIKTGFIPSSHGLKYLKDDSSFGVYAGIDKDESKVIMGMRDAGSTYSTYLFLRDTNKLYYISQSTSGGNIANTDSRGMYIVSRNATNETSTYKNKVKTSDNDSSVKLETNEFYILAYNAGGSPAFISSNQVSFAFAGRKLSDADVEVITDAFNNYLVATQSDAFISTMSNWGFSTYEQYSAQYFNGKTYIAYSGLSDDPYIITYDHSTGLFSSSVKIGTNALADGDWHGSPSLLIDSSGYLHVMWGAHNTAISYSKSNNPEDISAWTSMGSPDSNATYLRLFEIGSTLYLFFRFGYQHCYKTSVNGGTSWSAVTYISVSIAYFDFKQIGDKILCAGVGRDTAGYDIYNIYYFYLDNGQWKDAFGDNISLTIDPDDDPVMAYDSGLAYTPTATPFIDSEGNHYIFFMELTTGTGDPVGTYAYRILKFNGVSWDKYDIGVSTPRKSADSSAIEKVGSTIYVYLTTGGVSTLMGGNVERWKSIDEGQTWAKEQTIKEGNFVMPIYVKDGLQNAKIVFSEYTGNVLHFNLSGYLWGESGFVN